MSYPKHEGYKIVNEYELDKAKSDLFAPDKVVIGTTSNEVINALPKAKMTKEPVVLGHDTEGFVVEWHYPDVIFTFAYVERDYESAYCVQQIQVKDDNRRNIGN